MRTCDSGFRETPTVFPTRAAFHNFGHVSAQYPLLLVGGVCSRDFDLFGDASWFFFFVVFLLVNDFSISLKKNADSSLKSTLLTQ